MPATTFVLGYEQGEMDVRAALTAAKEGQNGPRE